MSTPQNKNRGLGAALILIIILLVVAFGLRRCRGDKPLAPQRNTTAPVNKPSRSDDNTVGLNRAPSHINYSKHARCRMACRHIDETEVRTVLATGSINYKKSALDADACHRRYAVEGNTKDGQRVRIIFAPCNDVETVVTVIDLGTEWSCDCR